MADSTVTDINKMKVVDLRKELKTRGLSSVGDKAELITRLTAAMVQDSNTEHGDINMDSDIDSDGVLEDEDDKSHGDILEDSAVDILNDELAWTDQPVKPAPATETKPPRTLKRRITASDTKIDEDKTGDKEPSTKKIVLNRTPISINTTTTTTKPSEEKVEVKPDPPAESNKVKITIDTDDSKSKLESRAKRFGLPVKMTEAERKEARMKRFGQSTAVSTSSSSISSEPIGSLSENLEKLKKRAERFGQSVSKIMTDIENKERLEKRKAKFSAA